MPEHAHEYAAKLIWTGNTGEGTARYTSYERSYRVLVEGKPELVGTADPAFRGEADKYNPEDLFLTSISACHMLTYLALCTRRGIRVVTYEDEARGTMTVDANGGGRFERVELHPTVTIDAAVDAELEALAQQLHETAHQQCFIANSCRIPIRHSPTIHVASRTVQP